MKTTLIYTGSGLFGNLQIHVEGLDDVLLMLERVNPELKTDLQKGLKQSMQAIVLPDFKRRAGSIADDGTFAASGSISQRANGTQWALRSNDEAAGVKEFAHLGARHSYQKKNRMTEKRRATTYHYSNVLVGVPHRSNAPRAMIPAVHENIDSVVDAIDSRMAETLERLSNG